MQVHPGHGRHHEVAQDQVELLAQLDEVERRPRVGDGDDSVLVCEGLAHGIADARIVVDDEDAAAPCRMPGG